MANFSKGEIQWHLSSRPSSSASRASKASTSTKRAAAFKAAAKKLGAKVTNVYWTLGEYDGVVILEAPDDETAMTVLLYLAALGNVHTTTVRAFTAAEMDEIVAKMHGG